MWLLIVAALGMLVPNGLFVYWLLYDDASISEVLSNRLAVAFMIDAFATAFLLSYLFARKPLGPYKWPWFLGLTLLGSLIFGLPLYLWLNWHRAPEPRPSFTAWWRSA